ncbi:50S ribosomal protein L33 [Micavibrio aeruginosavorus]|uniref:Large ribosomal subunit protein bL33 n=1 Tax=Micavibrio aeruginosavorus EPB TaxID=349215 RepID=M4VKP3_9BACT|nr:50S ribosomal protein L33 [Micavibrio aeruginosavorus]AGH98666.1 LSU ribosomal protein L33p [Micavibrio aeruginosavorus EPB]
MASKKGNAVKVRMESSAGTGFRYYTKQNAKAQGKKLELKKFDPWAIHPETGKKGAHVLFEQKKMPPSKK